MKTAIKPAAPKPVTNFDLECGGVIIGRAKINHEGQFHVLIDGGPGTGAGTLFQGFGPSLDAAIGDLLDRNGDLLDRNERQALAQLIQIRSLREMFTE